MRRPFLTKSTFDVESIISAAGELKYIGQIKREIAAQLASPGDEFLRFFIARVYDGTITARIREQFQPLLEKAIAQYTGDLVNDRLKSAITGVATNATLVVNAPPEPAPAGEPAASDDELKVVTTPEEMEGFFIVKSIVRTVVDPNRIGHRDTQSYLGILLDDNNRKSICRLHFNRAQKYVGVLDQDKKETRYPISSLDEIYGLSDALIEATKRVA